MKKVTVSFGIFLVASFLLQAYTQISMDEKLFQEAKILIFDKKWKEAQEKLEELLEKHVESRLFSQALFYKAKCIENRKGREVEAIKVYREFLQLKDISESLAEESGTSIIDLAYKLFEKGKKFYLKEIEERLDSSNQVIKYYAAHKLSFVKDRKTAMKAIPVLKEMLEMTNDELRDRAKIDLLKIDPDALKNIEEERYERRVRILKIRVYPQGRKVPSLSLDLPWALADLAFGAIPDKEKALMRKRGYDIDKIVRELSDFKGDIIKIVGKDIVIKIWIDF